MHEFGFAQQIADICITSAGKHGAKRIKDIYLEIGEFTLIIDDYLKQCFEMIAQDSPMLSGVNIHITRTPGVVKCQECGHETQIHVSADNPLTGINLFSCEKCHSPKTLIIRGKEANIKNLKIEVWW